MVTNTTIYTRQIYCVLHDDPPPADIEFRNGDELFIIDQDTRMIFDDENQTWRQIPMSGGGGGTLITKTITANGTYNAADDNADGYSEVTVNVAGPQEVLLGSGTITISGDQNISYPIPVTTTAGRTTRYMVVKESLPTNTCVGKWAGVFPSTIDPFSTEFAGQFVQGVTYKADQTIQGKYVYRGGTSYYMAGVDLIANPEQITILSYDSAYKIRAGTYNWYIWGYAT